MNTVSLEHSERGPTIDRVRAIVAWFFAFNWRGVVARDSSGKKNAASAARLTTCLPFVVLGIVAIVSGGVIAAAIAHQPSRSLVWMVAYLVLVVGVVQIVFGAGQAWLAARVPTRSTTWGQWLVFNVANACVIVGTLCNSTDLVALGTVAFVLALAWFLWGVHRCRHGGWGIAYRVLLALMLVSANVGLVLSVVSHAGYAG